MSFFGKSATVIILIILGMLSIAWAVLGTRVTLAGGMERSAVASGEVTYNQQFLNLMFGGDIIGISFFTWFGLATIVFSVVAFVVKRKSKKGSSAR